MADPALDSKNEGKEDPQTDLKGFENEFGDRASSPGFDAASDDMGKADLYKKDKKSTKTKLKAVVQNRKKALLIAGGGGSIALIIIIILIFLSSLIIPGFAANMLAYQFARVNRDFAAQTEELADEKASLESQDTASAAEAPLEDDAAMVDDYSATTGGLWTKLTGWTPSATINNLQTSGDLVYNYKKTLFGNKVLSTIDVGDSTIDTNLTDPSLFRQALHPIQTFKAQVNAASDIDTGINESLGDESGLIVRGLIASTIREQAGIPLYAWITSKFAGKTPTEADALLDQDVENRVIQPGDASITALDDAVASAENDGRTLTAADLQNLPNNDTAITNTDAPGVLPDVDNQIDNDVEGSLGGLSNTLLKSISTTYLVAVTACIIYDGSLQSPNAAQTINEQDNEILRSFNYVESAGDQQKAGDANAEVVGAMANKLGNVADSNVEIRANGGVIDTLSAIQSPQTTADGSYSILNTFLPAWLASLANGLATYRVPSIIPYFGGQTGCQIFTNPTTAVAFGAGQIIATIIASLPDGGAVAAGEAGGEAGTEVALDAATEAADSATEAGIIQSLKASLDANPVSSTLLRFSGKLAARFSPKELAKLGIIAGGTYGLTLLAKQEVLSQMGETYDGLSQGIDFANQADAGANFNANELERQQMYGAPLGANDLAYNNTADKQYLGTLNSSESVYNRYLAISNPSSLLSRLAIPIVGAIHSLSLHAVVSDVSSGLKSLLHPFKLASGLLGVVNNKKVSAASIVDNSDYGIVQWGYTQYENQLVDPVQYGYPAGVSTATLASYQPVENSKILFASGKDNYIQSTYGACYTDSMGQLLTQMPSSGPDTSDPYILRDAGGNVTGGLCSQAFLGPKSGDLNAKDGSYGNDLIFRWRLNNAYNNTIDQLIATQNAPSS